MITISLSSSPAKAYKKGWSTGVGVGLMTQLLPCRVVTCQTLAEVIAARTAYIQEVKAIGKGACICCYAVKKRGERKPNGFDAATPSIYVNL